MNFARRARKLGGVDAKAIGNCGASFYTENDAICTENDAVWVFHTENGGLFGRCGGFFD